MPSPEVHDALNDADLSNRFLLNKANDLRILLNNYDTGVKADVDLFSTGYKWTPASLTNKTIQTEGSGQQFVLVTSKPTRTGTAPLSGVILNVTVASPRDSAQSEFPVDFLESVASKASDYPRAK